ncbi:MAG: hypothetical protein ACK2UB_05220 [Anaerolineales bacterium]
MMDAVFDACVHILFVLAGRLGCTYKEINVWIFVILWPLLTLGMAVWIMALLRKIRRLEKTQFDGKEEQP